MIAVIAEARRALVARVVEGRGSASSVQRRAAFDAAPLEGALGVLVQKVREHAHRIADEDIAAVRARGLTEDQIFELVVSAAVGEATRRYDNGLAALSAALKDR